MIKRILPLLPVLAAGTLWAQEAPKLAETRTALEKWVETKQLTSRIQADWAAEKELLAESIKMFERESRNLDELIAKVNTGNDQVRKEREEQEKLQAQYQAATEKIKSLVTGLEKKVLALARTFPTPLAEKVGSFVKRIPEDAASTKLSASQRLQAVVAILSEADKFNGAITVSSELRKNSAGNEVQVQVVYLGLAQAYFTDKEGKFAGAGQPAADGWKWTTEPALAPAIARAIAVYESKQPPAFVALPAKVQ
ncbi:MAG: DUF3450 family protein [Verrucomicrobiota bacterium]